VWYLVIVARFRKGLSCVPFGDISETSGDRSYRPSAAFAHVQRPSGRRAHAVRT
jgi:hypothetical protein